MIREVSGRNGQIVTTWGRDLEGDTWVGAYRSRTTLVTCRCGRVHKHLGFLTPTSLYADGWFLFDYPTNDERNLATKEWFCSYACVREYEPEEAQKVVLRLRAQHGKDTDRYLKMVEDLSGSSSSGLP